MDVASSVSMSDYYGCNLLLFFQNFVKIRTKEGLSMYIQLKQKCMLQHKQLRERMNMRKMTDFAKVQLLTSMYYKAVNE